MPKPKSLGFPYSSQDTDTFQDVKIRLLISQHGCAGYTIWEYLKQAAYRENGYYVEWNDERKELAAADLYLSVENIGLIVAYLLKRSLLVSKSFNGVTVLTSHGIQKRFQEMAKAAKRDYYKFLPEVWLLSDEETYHFIFCTHRVDNSGINGNNSGIKADNSGIIPHKEKKRKEKENISSNEDNKVSKKESNKKKNQSYDEIFEDLAVAPIVKNALIEFIRHLQANGTVLINSRLEDIIINLDMLYGRDESAKVKYIKDAISKGYKRLPFEGEG